MACGNNMVSQAGLRSDPTPPGGPSSAGRRGPQLPPAQLGARREEARQAMDQAERSASAATSPAAASAAVKDARRALDRARRLPGQSRERAALVRDLESKLSKVTVAADRALAEARSADERSRAAAAAAAIEQDRLSRQVLGVVPSRPAPPPPGRGPVDPGPGPLQEELSSLMEGIEGNIPLGEFAEAVAAGLVVLVRGHDLLQQHHPEAGPHGLDIQSVDEDGKVWTFEVKGTRTAGKQPRTDRYSVGRQGSQGYVVGRSRDAPVVATEDDAVGGEADQMGSLLITVNLPDNAVQVWELDSDGKRGRTPLEMHQLDDVVQMIDTNNS